MLPSRRNCYFSSFGPPKTTSEPFKNRCQKRVVFQHRFFGVLASILEPLGLPRWSQVRRAAGSARRVRPYCLLKVGNTAFREGGSLPTRGPNPARLALCWFVFRSWASFFRSWLVLERLLHFFGSCWSFFSNFGPPRPRFWVVRARFQSLQNHI